MPTEIQRLAATYIDKLKSRPQLQQLFVPDAGESILCGLLNMLRALVYLNANKDAKEIDNEIIGILKEINGVLILQPSRYSDLQLLSKKYLFFAEHEFNHGKQQAHKSSTVTTQPNPYYTLINNIKIIFNAMPAFGYLQKSLDKGYCYGYSLLVVIFALNNDMASFAWFIKLLSTPYDENTLISVVNDYLNKQKKKSTVKKRNSQYSRQKVNGFIREIYPNKSQVFLRRDIGSLMSLGGALQLFQRPDISSLQQQLPGQSYKVTSYVMPRTLSIRDENTEKINQSNELLEHSYVAQ